MMRLTLLVLAINAERELTRILPELREIGDELVIGIDDTTTDGTEEVARQYTNSIHPVRHEGFCGRGRPQDLNAVEYMLPYCHGDWVLRVDQDETLSTLWHDRRYIASLLDDRFATHYCIPRRLVIPPGDRYIYTGRAYPDYQVRLYRNIPSLIQFNRRPHQPPLIAGERRFLADAWIIHWLRAWYDQSRRQQRVAFYWDLGYTKEDFPLEDEPVFHTRPLDYIYPSPSKAVAAASRQNGPFFASLEVLDCPELMQAGKIEPVLVGITNCSDRLFRPSSVFIRPANVLLSWHWLKAKGREIYVWDHERHDLPKPLAPGESASYCMSITAPKAPGDYLFQPDLVEEHVAWFSTHCPMPTHRVRVV